MICAKCAQYSIASIMKGEVYTHIQQVAEQHIDEMKHVNNVVYLSWVQDVGNYHWAAKTAGKYDEQYAWVALDHFIEYKRPAVLGDELVITTWVERREGARCIRYVAFHKDGKLVCQSKTNWAFISRERNRPLRIPDEIYDLFF